METRATYGVPSAIRAETLCEFTSWMPPNPDEIAAALSMASWSTSEFARKAGIEDRTARRWASGEKAMPYLAWCVLCVQAGLGELWRMPLPIRREVQ
jgi:hypothetical protein